MPNYASIDQLPPEYREQAAAEIARQENQRSSRGPGKTAVVIVKEGQPVARQTRQIQPQANESRSKLEIAMQSVIDTALSQFPHLDKPQIEYRFHKFRQWRFDFAWPNYVLAIEAEGGTWLQTESGFSKGHAHPKRFEDDCEKYNEAALDGWMVLRFTGDMVKDGRALEMLLRCLRFHESVNGR